MNASPGSTRSRVPAALHAAVAITAHRALRAHSRVAPAGTWTIRRHAPATGAAKLTSPPSGLRSLPHSQRHGSASTRPALLSGVGRKARSMMGFGELGRPSSQRVLDACTVQGS